MKSCTYCKSQFGPQMRYLGGSPLPRYAVVCHNCTARGPGKETAELAVEAWDHRPLEEELQRDVAALRGRRGQEESTQVGTLTQALAIERGKVYDLQSNRMAMTEATRATALGALNRQRSDLMSLINSVEPLWIDAEWYAPVVANAKRHIEQVAVIDAAIAELTEAAAHSEAES